MSKRCAIVIPVYRNEESLPELVASLESVAERIRAIGDLHTVFVVDGSPDSSYAVLHQQLANASFPSRLLLLSRNFGSFAAIRAGLAAVEADHYAVMAADLQEPPELAVEMFKRLADDEGDVVVGVRQDRDDPWTTKTSSAIFWRLYRRFIQPTMPAGGIDVFACTRQFRDHLLQLDESNSTLVGLVVWLGFRRIELPYTRLARKHGKSAWTLKKKLKYMRDSAFAFSSVPIRMLGFAGMIGCAAAMVWGAVVLALKFATGFDVPGYAAVMIAVLFFGGLNLMGLSIVGAYVWRTFENSKNRPQSVIALSHQFSGKEPNLRPAATSRVEAQSRTV